MRALAFVMRSMAIAVLASTGLACTRSETQHDVPAAADVAGPSIYALDLALIDDGGRTLRLSDLRGKALVAAMVYTTCTSVCPRVTEDMKAIERQLGTRDISNVTFVLFSLDPERDTPGALRRFAVDHKLDQSRWRLFAASEDDVRDLAAVLGVKYRTEDNGEIAHSALIAVIDREGVVRHRQLGLTENPGDLIDAVARATS